MQSELLRLVKRSRDLVRERGLLGTVMQGADKVSVYLNYPLKAKELKDCYFNFEGRAVPYFVHPYNATWRNERCVEVAIALEFLQRYGLRNWLELGNVMAYYGKQAATVVDKYERSPGVTNKDILNFEPKELFDAALSLSTFEHIGWDETPREPEKVLRAIAKFKSFIKPGGPLLVTFPLGHNSFLDSLVERNEVPFSRVCYLKRTSESEWKQVTREEVIGTKYGSPYTAANAIVVGMDNCEARESVPVQK